MRGQPHALTDKVKALVAAEITGSPRTASRMLGVPERTIEQWRQKGKTEPEISALADALATEAMDAMIVEVGEMLPALTGFIRKKIDEMVESNPTLSPRELQSITTTAAIWSDKLALWLEQKGKRSDRTPWVEQGQSPPPRELLRIPGVMETQAAGA